MSRDQIVAEMAKGMTPYSTKIDAQRQLFGADKSFISNVLGIDVRQQITGGEDAGQTVYSIDPADMFLPELEFTSDEAAVLSLALASIHHSIPQAGEALMKLAGARPARASLDFRVDLPLVAVRCVEAAQRRQMLKVVIGGTETLIEPWRVLFDKGTWYVIAHQRSAGQSMCELRAVKCSWISPDITLVDGESCCERGRLSESKVRELVHDARGELTEATVVFDAIGAGLSWWDPRIKEAITLPDGGLRVVVAVDDPARFRGWVLGFGEHATIESPQAVRDEFVAWLTACTTPIEQPSQIPSRPTTTSRHSGPRTLGERLHRLLSILPYLQNFETVDVNELASLTGCDPRNLLQDLQYASMCGVPPYTHDALFDFWVEDGRVHFSGVRSALGRRKSTSLMAGSVKLTPRQAVAVSLSLAGLSAVDASIPAVASLRHKLSLVVDESAVDVRFEAAPLMSEVLAAVEGCREISIEYANGEGAVRHLTLRPLLVFLDRGEAYVKADVIETESRERIFRIDRIVSLRETGQTFSGRTVVWDGNWVFRGDACEAIVRIAPGNDWVLDRVAHKGSVVADNGDIYLWLDVASSRWLGTLLLRCGAPSVVVSPTELRTAGADLARALLNHYTLKPDSQK